MEIAEHIFHFNDKGALDNQSSATSEAIYEHFWDSLLDNELAQEFLPAEVFNVRNPYHLVSFHPTYGAAILYKTLDSLEVFVRTVGLDKWEAKIHASSDGRECYAVPTLEAPRLMDQGPFPTHLLNKLEEALVQALRESEKNTGANRRNTPGNEGNQKTPSFLNEKLDQSIKNVVSDADKQVIESFSGNGSTYGGTTDVGLHSGGKQRNTAAPLVFSVVSTMLHLAGRPGN
ncbi:unnamed protein product [Cylindrotheca closterium]|uniref:Uncharacterized protein n=1 Tax=Cylindrotheca closterium TaxID=2856 RepID=A0AAD2G3Q0_9STRA|nr:unnamed protein product [Cylindrotheca closterium]